jgi:hypothetical protein
VSKKMKTKNQILMVGTARCAVPARSAAKGGTNVVNRALAPIRFRRLTLRSATGTAQRAIPTMSNGGDCFMAIV